MENPLHRYLPTILSLSPINRPHGTRSLEPCEFFTGLAFSSLDAENSTNGFQANFLVTIKSSSTPSTQHGQKQQSLSAPAENTEGPENFNKTGGSPLLLQVVNVQKGSLLHPN